MKHSLLFCLLALFGSSAFAQTAAERQNLQDVRSYLANSDYVYPYVDTPPFFPGGNDKWSRYVNSSALVLNAGLEAAKQGLQPGFYVVTVRFAINADGTVGETRTIGRQLGYGLEDAALTLVKNSGKWTPANIEGRDAKSWLQLNIRFHVFE
ncbi:energy transducer TonB [Flaviaesturariibacter terrae]